MGEPGKFLLFSWQNRKASNKILQVKGRGWRGHWYFIEQLLCGHMDSPIRGG